MRTTTRQRWALAVTSAACVAAMIARGGLVRVTALTQIRHDSALRRRASVDS